MIKVFFFFCIKCKSFWYSFNRYPFSSVTATAAAAFFEAHTHFTSHCVLNICKYLRWHDPKGDMIQMIYPENREKNYLNGCVAQHEALVRICGAYRTNAQRKKFRLNSHKSFLNRYTSAFLLLVRFSLVWFGLIRFVLLLSFCVARAYFFHHLSNISIIVTSFPLF